MRIINKVIYCNHTEPLFPKSHYIKFNELVYFKRMQIMLIMIENQSHFQTVYRENMFFLWNFTAEKAKKKVAERKVFLLLVLDYWIMLTWVQNV